MEEPNKAKIDAYIDSRKKEYRKYIEWLDPLGCFGQYSDDDYEDKCIYCPLEFDCISCNNNIT